MSFKFLNQNVFYDVNYCEQICTQFVKNLIDENAHITTIFPKTYLTSDGEITINSISYSFNNDFRLEFDCLVNYKPVGMYINYMKRVIYVV